MSQAEAYKQIPDDLVGAYTSINLPLDVVVGHKLNVLSVLKAIASPGDYVVFKIDISRPDMERYIINALRTEPEFGTLVSELYFEHHFNVGPMRKYWGTPAADLKDSFDLFHDLRANGIRAHTWP